MAYNPYTDKKASNPWTSPTTMPASGLATGGSLNQANANSTSSMPASQPVGSSGSFNPYTTAYPQSYAQAAGIKPTAPTPTAVGSAPVAGPQPVAGKYYSNEAQYLSDKGAPKDVINTFGISGADAAKQAGFGSIEQAMAAGKSFANMGKPTVISSGLAKDDLANKSQYINDYDAAKAQAQADKAAKDAQAKADAAAKAEADSKKLLGEAASTSAEGTELTPAQQLAAKYTEIDNQAKTDLDDFNKKVDDLYSGATPFTESEQAQINELKMRYQKLIDQQAEFNKNYEGSITQFGIVTGRSRYAPTIESGNIKQAVDQGISKISELESAQANAIENLKTAIRDKNYKRMEAAYNASSKYLEARKQTIKDINQAVKEEAAALLEKKKYDLEAEKAQQEEDKNNIDSLSDLVANNLESGMSQEEAQTMVQDMADIYGFDANFLMSSGLAKQQQLKKENKATGFYGEYLSAIANGLDPSTTPSQFKQMISEPESALDQEYKQAQIDKMYADMAKTTAPKVQKINGVDMTWDANANNGQGSFVPINAGTKEQWNTSVESAKSTINKIDELLSHPGLNAAVGWRGPTAFIKGSQAQQFKALADSLTASLKLENMGIMKGVLSDADMKVIAEASTPLSDLAPWSNTAYVEKLTDIKNQIITKAGQKIGIPPSELEEAIKAKGASAVFQQIQIEAEKQMNSGGQSFNQGGSGTPIATKAAKIPDGKTGGQCGRFVNQLTGLGVGDSYASKMAKMDKSIKYPQPGMVFTMPYGKYGHTGIILGINNGIATVKDSNWDLDEQVATHTIPISQMTGFARV